MTILVLILVLAGPGCLISAGGGLLPLLAGLTRECWLPHAWALLACTAGPHSWSRPHLRARKHCSQHDHQDGYVLVLLHNRLSLRVSGLQCVSLPSARRRMRRRSYVHLVKSAWVEADVFPCFMDAM